jgi:REP element-mobilizing transposase RayT
MTSPKPLLFGEYYHIFNRGNNREDIFFEDRNYAHFLRLYEKYIHPIAETYAYCLLKNHFHILVRIKTEEDITETLKVSQTYKVLTSDYPSRRFSDLFNAYSKAVNKAYGRVGALFQHPFGRTLINDEIHLTNVIAYVHANPQKHHFVSDYTTWKYSSYGDLTGSEETILHRKKVIDWFGGKNAFIEFQNKWVEDASIKWMADKDE